MVLFIKKLFTTRIHTGESLELKRVISKKVRTFYGFGHKFMT